MKIDEDKYPSMEELKIDRNEDGEIIPVKGETPGLERPIIVKPMPSGANKEHFGDVAFAGEVDDSTKAEVLNEYYVRPEFDVDANDVKNNFDRQTINDYLQGLMAYSGANRSQGELVDEDGGSPNN